MSTEIKMVVRQGDIGEKKTAAAVVNLFQGVAAPGGAAGSLDRASGGAITRALEAGDFKGAAGDILVLYPDQGKAERILVCGLGSEDDFDLEVAQAVGISVGNKLREMGVVEAVSVLHGGLRGSTEKTSRALAEGVLTGLYRYDRFFKDGRASELKLETLVWLEKTKSKVAGLRRGIAEGEAFSYAAYVTRDLVNGPSNLVTPTYLANTAKKMGKEYGFKVKVLNRDQCEKLGMGSFLAVAQGSDEPCKFIIMEYTPARPKGTVCLVGKGITFDTGGISLKPPADMDQMKFDMGGAAAVFGAMRFAACKKVGAQVVGIVAATENMPSGKAYKPGDVLTAMNGVTIEVLNTDAEGRLILADALAYAERYNPDAVIDLATLTGACVIALGHTTAVMGNDEWLLDRVLHAGNVSRDKVWPLPLWSNYREAVKSNIADIKNSTGREAGAITAGAFLGAFTHHYRWVHMDIAGSVWKNSGAGKGGATGSGMPTLGQFLLDFKKPKGDSAKPKPGPRTSLRKIKAGAAGGPN